MNEKILRLKQSKLKKYLKNRLSKMGYEPILADGYLYAGGTIPVLLVAHLDTVHHTPVTDILYSQNGRYIMSPQGIGGDDRAGIHIIMEVVQTLKCHVLFCEDEESGAIGARAFTKSGIKPQVNYLVELDRRGIDDAVFYDCDNREFVKFIEKFGFNESSGSFSDISVIAPHLGIAAVNLSCGFYNEHTIGEYIDMKAVKKTIRRVKEMVQTESQPFKYVKKKYKKPKYFNVPRKYHDTNALYGLDGYEDDDTFTIPDGCYVVSKNGEMFDGEFYETDINGNVYGFGKDLEWRKLAGYKVLGSDGSIYRHKFDSYSFHYEF